MKLNDAMKARRSLVTLLRHPEKWPENYAFTWGSPDSKTFAGFEYGCARALGEIAGIVEYKDLELELTDKQVSQVFFGKARTPRAIANEIEQTIPIHEMLL